MNEARSDADFQHLCGLSSVRYIVKNYSASLVRSLLIFTLNQPISPITKIARMSMGRTIRKYHFAHVGTFIPLPRFVSF